MKTPSKRLKFVEAALKARKQEVVDLKEQYWHSVNSNVKTSNSIAFLKRDHKEELNAAEYQVRKLKDELWETKKELREYKTCVEVQRKEVAKVEEKNSCIKELKEEIDDLCRGIRVTKERAKEKLDKAIKAEEEASAEAEAVHFELTNLACYVETVEEENKDLKDILVPMEGTRDGLFGTVDHLKKSLKREKDKFKKALKAKDELIDSLYTDLDEAIKAEKAFINSLALEKEVGKGLNKAVKDLKKDLQREKRNVILLLTALGASWFALYSVVYMYGVNF